MFRGKIALVIPSTIDTRGSLKVARELKRQGVDVLGRDELIVVPWNAKARRVLQTGVSAQAFYADKVPAGALRKLPPSAVRIAKLWNWSIDNHGRQVSTAAVERFQKSLKLKVKDGKVYDTLKKKTLGRVVSKESKDKKGNWSLWQSRGWTMVPGWFGWWEKLYCWSQTYRLASYGGAYETVDFISAQVTGPNHYSYQSRTNSPVAYAEDWTYIWVGMTRGGRAYSYARNGNTVRQITGPNMWPRY